MNEHSEPANNGGLPAPSANDVVGDVVLSSMPPGGFPPDRPRRLSIVRVAAAVAIVAGAIAGGLALGARLGIERGR